MSAISLAVYANEEDVKMSQGSSVAPRVKRGVDPVLTSLVATGALGTIAGAGVLPLVTGHLDEVSDTIARIQEKRRRSGRPTKVQRLLKSVKKNVMSSLRRAYYGDPKDRVRARRQRYQLKSRQAQNRGFLRFVRERIRDRLVKPMVRGVRRLVKDEARFRDNLKQKRRGGRPSSRRGQQRQRWNRDGSISLRCYHNPRLRGCGSGRRAGRRPPRRL